MSNDSVNEVSDSDGPSGESRSPSRSVASPGSSHVHGSHGSHGQHTSGHSFNLGFHHSPQHHHQNNHQMPPAPQGAIPFPHASPSSDFLRPLLQHKSRSTNNVNRVRSNSSSTNQTSSYANSDLRQHRDSFLQNNPLVDENSKYFGVSLADAITQASAKISILGATAAPKSASDDVLHYGRIPVVVAKCGVYLKKNGLNVEGIFRVGGASKRIKELQIIFNSPPEFGKKLSWDGYTVHDAASVLRRYLNALPEPLIPLHLYDEFRDPLKARPRIIKYMRYKAENPSKVRSGSQEMLQAQAQASRESSQTALSDPPQPQQSQSVPQANHPEQTTQPTAPFASEKARSEAKQDSPLPTKAQRKARNYKKLTRDVYEAIDEYKELLDDVPQLSKQLLFYILDLLAMVQSNAHENLMSARNLAAIFQPSILSHPNHDMDPDEYALSQSVVEFLIQYAYKLLPNQEQSSPEPATPTPIDTRASPKAEAKPAAASYLNARTNGRQHSQSLSSPNPDDLDLIGFRNTTAPGRGVTLSDTEQDFASGSSDDEYVSDAGQRRPRQAEVPNLLYVVNADASDEAASGGYESRGSSKLSPPIIVSEAPQG
ncbi:uncharacterized protein CXQ87_003438 [Candidozyma duobushaemuli]|uniref:Rho-GAP domain-containing protein n=2 Tax=Candidozyma TaxID=3303203 RepID=A0ABX8I679_9ASCO|nr:uncharacterized protein CXQ87_003438 [[Candida] duobushaemulonis]PVH15592.1 hypothetical protein CXQ87_003438 [[Candida] duobushaemulonis]QWU88786.1 hypothetical protein CA3LBN_003094 [[Candida] haemuloni]